MREIKFRGLMTTGQWVFGLPHLDLKGSTHYFDECSYRICWNPESGGQSNAPIKNGTLSQYTGLHDKNGKEIYEGDIYHMGDKKITYTVVWHDSGLIGKQNGSSSYAGLEHWMYKIEVIGNIYETT